MDGQNTTYHDVFPQAWTIYGGGFLSRAMTATVESVLQFEEQYMKAPKQLQLISEDWFPKLDILSKRSRTRDLIYTLVIEEMRRSFLRS